MLFHKDKSIVLVKKDFDLDSFANHISYEGQKKT